MQSLPLRRTALLLAAWLLPAAASRAAEIALATLLSAHSLPLYVAQAQGLFAAERLDVRLVECRTGARCLSLLLPGGGADIATASELAAVFNAFERDDFALIATIASSSTSIRAIGRRSAAVDRAAQLPGKRIGVAPGSSARYFLDVYLLYHGIEPGRVTPVPVAVGDAVGAFQRREIDALVTYPQYALAALRSLKGDGVALAAPRLYTETVNLVASRRLLAARADDVTRLLRAVDRAERWIADNPAAALQLLQARLGGDPADVAAAFPGYVWRLGMDPSLVGTMEREARWALREGHVARGRGLPHFTQLVAPGPLRAAVPGALQD